MKKLLITLLIVATVLISATPQIYKEAREEFKQGNYIEAQKIFQDFILKYPNSVYTGNGYFWIGMCNYNRKLFEDALINFKSVLTTKTFWKYSDAMYKAGECYQKLNDQEAAQKMYQLIIAKYQKNGNKDDLQFVEKAKKKVK